jgi:hypothetical protein
MQELRAAIGVLHDPGGDGSPRAPVAGLAQLDAGPCPSGGFQVTARLPR